jgi:opacity protein-like surface antigen
LSRILLRVYYDFTDEEEWQSTLSTFAGYEYDRITAGAEYNRKRNSGFNKDYNQCGLSAYLSYDVTDKFQVFGRYDRLSSNQPPEYTKPWNLQDDGSAIIAGVQYQPINHVKLALNYRDWFPYAANMGNKSYIYLNLEVVL